MRSKFNAVTHGMRAESLVLPGEDPQAIEDRRDAWRASILQGVRPSRVSDLVPQPIMPLDLPVKVRPWELTVYPRRVR